MEWYKERTCGIHFKMYGLSTSKGRISSPGYFTIAIVDAGIEIEENNY